MALPPCHANNALLVRVQLHEVSRVAVKRSVAARGCYRLEFFNEQYQWDAHQYEPAERGEAIQKRQKGSLAFQESEGLRLRVNHGVGMGEAMSGKIIGEIT
jgi:hypothetical protein